MEIRIRLDADHEAVVSVMMEEDMHYPLEPVMVREANATEFALVVAHLERGDFRVVPKRVAAGG